MNSINPKQNTGENPVFKICAVVVAFLPDHDELGKAVAAIRNQADMILILDNSPSPDPTLNPRVSLREVYLWMGDNMGLAAAYNKGFEWAGNNGCTHVLLLDQDSIASPGMVRELLKAQQELEKRRHQHTVVGPQLTDEKYTCPVPFIKLKGLRLRRISCSNDKKYIEADYLASSGTLLKLDTVREIGPMDDNLFIDYVDIEWGLRAASSGCRCFGVCSAGMLHNLGDSTNRFWLLKWWEVPVHSPLRHYYLIRNALHLYRRPYISLNWKINDAGRMMLKFCYYSLLTPPRPKHFVMMLTGLYHGLIGRKGKYPGQSG